MLPQVAGPLDDARACRSGNGLQRSSHCRLDEPRQLGEAHKVTVGGQVLDRLLKRPLIQRVDEIQRGMASTPLERVGTIAHLPCLMSAITYIINLHGYVMSLRQECAWPKQS